jgi:hypothetical protein
MIGRGRRKLHARRMHQRGTQPHELFDCLLMAFGSRYHKGSQLISLCASLEAQVCAIFMQDVD